MNDISLLVRMTFLDKGLIGKAARVRGMKVSTWVRETLILEAERVLAMGKDHPAVTARVSAAKMIIDSSSPRAKRLAGKEAEGSNEVAEKIVDDPSTWTSASPGGE